MSFPSKDSDRNVRKVKVLRKLFAETGEHGDIKAA